MLTKEERAELERLRRYEKIATVVSTAHMCRRIELERRDTLSWEPTETEGTHKDGRFVELCCGEIQGRAHTIVGRWNIDAQDRAGWYGTDGNAIEGATHWRELSALPGRE